MHTQHAQTKLVTHKSSTLIYGTAQRQLDTHTCAAAWNFSCKDCIMRSIFEWAPITIGPISGKSSGMCTCKCSTLMKLDINCIYMMNLWNCLCIFQWILESIVQLKNCSRAVAVHAISHFLLFGVENGSFIGNWISINLFMFGLSVGCKPVRNMLATNIVCQCQFLKPNN